MKEILHRLVCFNCVCQAVQKPSAQCDSDVIQVLLTGTQELSGGAPGCLHMQMTAAANHVSSLSAALDGGEGRFDLQLSNYLSPYKVLHIKLIATVSSTQTEQEGQKCREWERCWIPALQGSYGLKQR